MMLGKVLKLIGIDWGKAGGSQSEWMTVPAPALVASEVHVPRRPAVCAWCVVVRLDRCTGAGPEVFRTRPTTDLVKAMRLACHFREQVFFAALCPAAVAKHLPLMPEAVVMLSVPRPMTWVESMHRRQCLN